MPPLPERAALVLGRAAPDAGLLACRQRPVEAVSADGAALAYGLGLFGLLYGGAGGADREEALWVDVEAGGAFPPVSGARKRACGFGHALADIDKGGA